MDSKIEGVHIFGVDKFEDDRGWLIELFRLDCLKEENHPKMGYVSMTLPGVVRGPHEHKHQLDMFIFIGPGDFELHLWEQREEGDLLPSYSSGNSWTQPYTIHEKHTFGKSNPAVVVVPPGVVHAYKNVSEELGLVLNFPNQLYAGPGRNYPVDEIRYEESCPNVYKVD